MFHRILMLIAIVLTNAVVASACPAGLRPFNKKLAGKNACVLEGTYVGTLELSSGFNYVLLGAVFVGSEKRDGNLQLTEPIQSGRLIINPGVTLFALNPSKDTTGFWKDFKNEKNQLVQGDIKSFLSITRDSQVEIKGTQSAPVFMTSGQGAHLQNDAKVKRPGDWGGIVISGKAKSNKCSTFENCTVPGEANTGFYAGSDDNHSSGAIQFLQVEFGGDRIDEEKELNGITFNAVGLGTFIENIAVLYNADDCIEFFGGAVTARNIFCYKGEDDGVDTTDGARVFLQNGIVVATPYPEAGADNDRHMVEADSSKNDAANALLRSHPVLVNFTFVGAVNSQGLMIRRNTDYTLVNSVMIGVDRWCLKLDGAHDLSFSSNVFADCSAQDLVKSLISGNEFVAGSILKMQAWLPGEGSPLLTGAEAIEEFSTDENLDEIFGDMYMEVDYRGAMGEENWTTWIQIRD